MRFFFSTVVAVDICNVDESGLFVLQQFGNGNGFVLGRTFFSLIVDSRPSLSAFSMGMCKGAIYEARMGSFSTINTTNSSQYRILTSNGLSLEPPCFSFQQCCLSALELVPRTGFMTLSEATSVPALHMVEVVRLEKGSARAHFARAHPDLTHAFLQSYSLPMPVVF